MAFTCGFFNSENGDRKYNAEQMSAIFDGIIADGVFTTIGDHMAVTPGTGMQVLVGAGKAWFDHTWNVNDAAYPLAIAASDVTLSRIDAIVLETNHSDSVRLNKLRVVQGTVASTPVKPTLTNSEKVHQHPLAWVTVAPGATKIAASAIENAVGTSACPFVTGIIATTAIDDLFNQWNGEFDEWFDNLKAQLSDNVVANLQKQIDERVKIVDKATSDDISKGVKDKWVDPLNLKGHIFSPGDIKITRNYNQPVEWHYTDGSPFLIKNASPLISKTRSQSDVYTHIQQISDRTQGSSVTYGCGILHNNIVYLLHNNGVKSDDGCYCNIIKIPLTEDGIPLRNSITTQEIKIPFSMTSEILSTSEVYPFFILVNNGKFKVYFSDSQIYFTRTYQFMAIDIDISSGVISNPVGIAIKNLSDVPSSIDSTYLYSFKQFEDTVVIVHDGTKSIIEYRNGDFFWKEAIFEEGYSVPNLFPFHSKDGWYFATPEPYGVRLKGIRTIWRGLNCLPLDVSAIPWVSSLNASTGNLEISPPIWIPAKQKYAWMTRTTEPANPAPKYYLSIYETNEMDSDVSELVSKIPCRGLVDMSIFGYGSGYYGLEKRSYPATYLIPFNEGYDPNGSTGDESVFPSAYMPEVYPIISHANVDYFIPQITTGSGSSKKHYYSPLYIGDTAVSVYDFIPKIADTASGKHFIKMR